MRYSYQKPPLQWSLQMQIVLLSACISMFVCYIMFLVWKVSLPPTTIKSTSTVDLSLSLHVLILYTKVNKVCFKVYNVCHLVRFSFGA